MSLGQRKEGGVRAKGWSWFHAVGGTGTGFGPGAGVAGVVTGGNKGGVVKLL